MAVDMVPELIRAGVRSFKIEGRLKGPEYVAITTRAYRQAVDEAWQLLTQQQPLSSPSSTEAIAIIDSTIPGIKGVREGVQADGEARAEARVGAKAGAGVGEGVGSFVGPDAAMRSDLAQVFARAQDETFGGLSAGFLRGVQHQDLGNVHGALDTFRCRRPM